VRVKPFTTYLLLLLLLTFAGPLSTSFIWFHKPLVWRVLPGHRGVNTNRFDNNDWTYFERNNNIIIVVVRESASKHYHELVILCDLGSTTKDFIPRLSWVIYFETSRKNAHELSIVLIFAISVKTHSFSCPGNSVSTPHASSIVSQWKTNKRTLD